MDKEFNDLDQRLNEFKVFDDSLIGNQNFKKKILDTVSTVSELQQVKANKKRELEQKLSDFKLTLEDRNKLTKRLKLFESARVLTNGLFVTLALILIIGRATKLNKQN
ncbi:MAG: hypothetical protein KF846_03075 [Cyclobacteriaceae bacterium]|nr:hypothetical protein [Cyclobacteriaceae bacterium]